MNQNLYGFGPHLKLDLRGCSKEKLSDLKLVYFLLDDLPAKIGMTKIAPPQVISYPGKEGSFDKGGISAFVLIAESHATIHTFIEQEYAFVDIFSCKEFDIEFAEKYFLEAFEAKKSHKTITNRGIEFPKSIPLATEIVKEERKDIN
ncbi:MAG: S-adenosylmethionine decarboxylase [Nanoarchaeota archaeon]